jgi:hypothetical protein
MSKDKKLWIDCCAGSELKDTQGETLSIEGADISELQAGRGRWNDDHGKGFFNHLGIITEAKKIFKSEDCENERQKYYWEKIKAPFIYAKGYVHSNEDHPNAKAVAAILRNIHREDVPLKLKASVEGGVISRGISDPTRLAQTKIHSVALTFTPANTATLVEPLSLDKSNQNWEVDNQLIKSVMHLAETNIPSFRHIERHASASTILENINKIQELAKSVGLEISVSPASTETIMKGAASYKIEQNIRKINELVKAIDPKTGLAARPPLPDTTRNNVKAKESEVRNLGMDKYQQGIGKLKTEAQMGPTISNIPNKPIEEIKPKTETVPLVSGNAFAQKQAEIAAAAEARKAAKLGQPAPVSTAPVTPQPLKFEDHVNNAMQDPGYLDALHEKFKSKGIDPIKAQQVINKLRTTVAANSKLASHSKIRDNLIKALTAGFGGSGSPMDLSGGGVFQTEALDSPRKSSGMKYITCDNCGDEQVHMKHQVKCRKCHRNFNFDKLKDLI